MKKLLILLLIAAGVYYFFDDIENLYYGYTLDISIEQAYADGNIPPPEVFRDITNRAMVEDLISSGRFTREEATELIYGLD